MTPIRYAIWAAVSTETQAAEDKYSLETQVEKSRATANAKGWRETAGPYIVPGESRTRFINLSDAERQIPALRQLLDDAQAGKFDLIACLDYDRFRELLDPVARTLAHYGVQLYAVNQPIEPQNPDLFGPYTSDSEFLVRGLNQIISRAAIANLRRKHASEMPKRVLERGLPAGTIPWGYRKPPGRETDRKAVPEIDPEIAQHLLWIKDWFLMGRSTHQIALELERLGVTIPTTRRSQKSNTFHGRDTSTVIRALKNPYYAGLVRWGITRAKRDLRTGKTHREKGQIQLAPGKHQPLWDEATWRAILDEFERRAPRYRGRKTNQLSGLLRCGICGAVLWRHTSTKGLPSKKENNYMTWRCKDHLAAHISPANSIILTNLAQTLQTIIDQQISMPVPTQNSQHELAKLREKRIKLVSLHLDNLVDRHDYITLLAEIESNIETLEQKEKNRQRHNEINRARQEALEALRSISLSVGLLNWLQNDDPIIVNTALQHLIDHIVVDANGNIINLVLK